ncbi:hypothetical protein M409DRAFT_61288 [Zasmidium cellare ATCC 36951]|uniref:Uncharacterized protein n=1 Tax=Zasmidium cellare ATCC 36951 TaxID=1080233 RepID=A0A6A6BVN6_ZASCE|nr:uncharacterized protein M409DRAFT_61288 [Zasmidium cellare ATCC 36951]KAF2158867.1 hypothetical protein M409DRAFT_61288 [Zasmidium cellare ATCC 36951]
MAWLAGQTVYLSAWMAKTAAEYLEPGCTTTIMDRRTPLCQRTAASCEDVTMQLVAGRGHGGGSFVVLPPTTLTSQKPGVHFFEREELDQSNHWFPHDGRWREIVQKHQEEVACASAKSPPGLGSETLPVACLRPAGFSHPKEQPPRLLKRRSSEKQEH